jgi:hypothetical protein
VGEGTLDCGSMLGSRRPERGELLAGEELQGKVGSEAGVLVRKLSQLTPLSQAKRANPRYFIMLFEMSCELAGCEHWPIVDSESTIAG